MRAIGQKKILPMALRVGKIPRDFCALATPQSSLEAYRAPSALSWWAEKIGTAETAEQVHL